MKDGKRLKVGVHSGTFHADDCMAVAILMAAASIVNATLEVIRTRVQALLDGCDILLDIGGRYEKPRWECSCTYGPSTSLAATLGTKCDCGLGAQVCLDHHQVGAPERVIDGTPYAAGGLVWKHYAHLFTANDVVVRAVDAELLRYIDIRDNGHGQGVATFELEDLVSARNPLWDEPDADTFTAFMSTVALMRRVFERKLCEVESRVAGYEVIERAIQVAHLAGFTADGAGGHVLLLDCEVDWKQYVIEHAPDALYVVYQCRETGEWHVHCVPPVLGSYRQRKPLPIAWAGAREGELQAVTEVPTAKFCHKARFICGAYDREGAYALAKKAVLAAV